MTERPILFSGEMVKAILEGRKTQTRRVVQGIPDSFNDHREQGVSRIDGAWRFWASTSGGGETKLPGGSMRIQTIAATISEDIVCPYGVPGDRLWVRETFMFAKGADVRENYIGTKDEPVLGDPPHYAYRATDPDFGGGMFKWRPAIFMLRHASRITLEIVSIRVERVQYISLADAIAEGMQSTEEFEDAVEHAGAVGLGTGHIPLIIFRNLWHKLNAKRGFGWDVNPWVWVIEFKRVHA